MVISRTTNKKKVIPKKTAKKNTPKKITVKKPAVRTIVKKAPAKKVVTRKPAPKTQAKKPAKKSVIKKSSVRKVVRKKVRIITKKIEKKVPEKRTAILSFERHEANPVIQPNTGNHWESKATFNPAALFAEGKIHLLYRAIGDNDVSVLGYAVSQNGFDVEGQLPHPAYAQHKAFEADMKKQYVPPAPYSSGGGWNGGCEDPRLTLVDDTVHLIYTAFDGWGSIRVAMSTLPLKNFLENDWRWTKPIFLSPPQEIHKNWVLFPEKIRGKYAILHSISPNVLIDYVDDMKIFSGEKFIRSYYSGRSGRAGKWDNWVRGVGPTPMKTKYGWLVLYHAMDNEDPDRYKLGAMLLDLNDPTKVLYRSRSPFLEPDVSYENDGFKAGVVYCCGSAIMNDTLFIYYGGADTVTCVATLDLEKFMKELMSGEKSVTEKNKTLKKKK